MAKFYGGVGFASGQNETEPGVWEDAVTTRNYFGDVIRNTRQLREGMGLNDDLTVSNSISILADAYANEQFFAIKYVEWMGTRWTVSDIEVQRPRLILRLGEVYNGPIPAGTP